MPSDDRSFPGLFSTVAGNLAKLVRKEGELVRAEVVEKIEQAGRAGRKLSVGAALLIGGFLVLLQALVLLLSKVMDPFLASLTVGVATGLCGFALVRSAEKEVQPRSLAPDRATRQLQKDVQLMKEQAL
jgi:hypothetical protein